MNRTAEQVQAETMNYAGVVLLALLSGLAVICFLIWLGHRAGTATAYRQFATGQATVITYTVPGAGLCRAVLVDGQRHAETCEEGEK